MIPFCKL